MSVISLSQAWWERTVGRRGVGLWRIYRRLVEFQGDVPTFPSLSRGGKQQLDPLVPLFESWEMLVVPWSRVLPLLLLLLLLLLRADLFVGGAIPFLLRQPVLVVGVQERLEGVRMEEGKGVLSRGEGSSCL